MALGAGGGVGGVGPSEPAGDRGPDQAAHNPAQQACFAPPCAPPAAAQAFRFTAPVPVPAAPDVTGGLKLGTNSLAVYLRQPAPPLPTLDPRLGVTLARPPSPPCAAAPAAAAAELLAPLQPARSAKAIGLLAGLRCARLAAAAAAAVAAEGPAPVLEDPASEPGPTLEWGVRLGPPAAPAAVAAAAGRLCSAAACACSWATTASISAWVGDCGGWWQWGQRTGAVRPASNTAQHLLRGMQTARCRAPSRSCSFMCSIPASKQYLLEDVGHDLATQDDVLGGPQPKVGLRRSTIARTASPQQHRFEFDRP